MQETLCGIGCADDAAGVFGMVAVAGVARVVVAAVEAVSVAVV